MAYSLMPDGVRLSSELPDWVRLAIADSVVLFGRMEQEIIEIAWLMASAELKGRLQFARTPATQNFIDIIEAVEQSQPGTCLAALKDAFRELADQRNLIVHGAWAMVDQKPWVVWHKFIEDMDSVIGQFFEAERFERFMLKGAHILDTLRKYHDLLEAQTGTVTTAMPR